MKLSIIIPVYNVEKYVEKCIRSCENQNISKEDYEVVVVNDGSPDGSLVIVERLAKEYPNIKIISQNNQGLSGARNTGFMAAKGEYVWFVDSDDWIEKDCLANIISLLNGEDVLAMGYILAHDDVSLNRVHDYKKKEQCSGWQLLNRENITQAQFYISRREFLLNNDLSFYPGIFHEDSEYTPRMLYKARTVTFLDKPVYFFYKRPNSITTSLNPKKAFDRVIIARNLHEYELATRHECKKRFDDKICQVFNCALDEIEKCSSSEQEKFNTLLYENKELLMHFVNSPRFRHKVQGVLFMAFPHHVLQIHNNMNKWKCLCHLKIRS